MKNEKFCIDCKWFRNELLLSSTGGAITIAQRACLNPKCMFDRDIVTGVPMKHTFCSAGGARTEYFNCGIDAKHFESIE